MLHMQIQGKKVLGISQQSDRCLRLCVTLAEIVTISPERTLSQIVRRMDEGRPGSSDGERRIAMPYEMRRHLYQLSAVNLG